MTDTSITPEPGRPAGTPASPAPAATLPPAGALGAGDAAATPAPPAPAATLLVDWLRCAGHGVCAAAFGERVGLDRWGFPNGVTARGVPITAEQLPPARLAVRTCPAAALRLARP